MPVPLTQIRKGKTIQLKDIAAKRIPVTAPDLAGYKLVPSAKRRGNIVPIPIPYIKHKNSLNHINGKFRKRTRDIPAIISPLIIITSVLKDSEKRERKNLLKIIPHRYILTAMLETIEPASATVVKYSASQNEKPISIPTLRNIRLPMSIIDLSTIIVLREIPLP